MTPCEERLAALAAPEELDGAARDELEAHLMSCPACLRTLRELRDTEALLQSTAREPHPLSAERFVAATVARAEAHRDRSLRGIWAALTRPYRAAVVFSAGAFAAACLLFVAAPRRLPAADPLARGPSASALQGREGAVAEWGVATGMEAFADGDDGTEWSDASASAADEPWLGDAFFGLSADEVDALSQALEST